METSTAVKCPNIYSVLSNLKPVYSSITQKEYLQKYFKDEELIVEMQRFYPEGKILSKIENKEEKAALINEMKENLGLGWVAFNFANYYNNNINKKEETCLVPPLEAINLIEADNSKESEFIFIQSINPPKYNGLVISDKQVKKNCLTHRLGIIVFTLISDNKVIFNKNIAIQSKSVPSEESFYNSSNSLCFEKYALDVPLLRADIDIKKVSSINYN